MNARSVAASVLGCELRRLLRDRRAVLTAVVLPVVLYPLLFLGIEKLETVSEESLESEVVEVAFDLGALDPERARDLEERLREPARRIDLREIDLEPGALADLGPEERRARVAEILGEEGDALLVARAGESEDEGPRVLVLFDGAQEQANEARRRIDAVLDEVRSEVRAARLGAWVGHDPAASVLPEAIDVARPEDSLGRSIGGLLPLLAVMVILAGGSFAALDAFAGEREAETLETLLVQPVPAVAIAWGKLLAVVATATVAFVANVASFLACIFLGAGELPGVEPASGGSIAIGRIALALLLWLPTLVLLSALLCLVSARARSFREGQHLLLPLNLVLIGPAAIAMMRGFELDPLLALVPIAGPSLALRDALAGSLRALPACLAAAASVGWAALALRGLARTLDAERSLRTRDVDREAGARRLQSRDALRFGVAAILVAYVVGGALQSRDLVWGIALTQWVVLPSLALLAARATARRAREPLARALELRPFRPLALPAAALVGAGLAPAVLLLHALQSRFLPVEGSVEELERLLAPVLELGWVPMMLLLAVSPAIQEELLFRGAILSGLRRDLAAWKVVAWQALLFGAFHLDLARFLPTAVVGGTCAAIVLRTGSVVPAMVVHLVYNGTLTSMERARAAPPVWLAGALVLGAALFTLGETRARARS